MTNTTDPTMKKILVVCTANKLRSKTAEVIYKDHPKAEVKSAGTDKMAENQVNESLLSWADLIIVMENSHRNWIGKKYRDFFKSKRIVILGIPDEFEFMQPELITLLKARMDRFIE